MNCPICGTELSKMLGHKMFPNNSEYGVTLYCLNPSCACEEVFGHADNELKAYEIILAKYVKS